MPPKKFLSLADKVVIINRVEAGVKRSLIEEEYGIRRDNISKIMKKKDMYLTLFNSNLNNKRKSTKMSSFPLLDEKMVLWVNDMTSREVTVSRLEIHLKALTFAKELGLTNFKAADGWITNMCRRQGVGVVVIHGEAGAVSEVTVNEWRSKLPTLIAGFHPDDIFNADEEGLFHKLLPSKTYAMKGSKIKAGKFSKERITLLLGSNASGTEKLPPLVIGKFQNPRCFTKGMKKPLMYRWNSKAWMTSSLFEEYMRDLNRKMVIRNRKILMFLDNCSAHPHQLRLSNITFVFFPANTTSCLQPMDQGVIKCFKNYYRQKLIRFLINSLDSNPGTTVRDFPVNLKQSMEWIKVAWDTVTQMTLINCFRKAGFSAAVEGEEEENNQLEFYHELQRRSGGELSSADEYLSVDDDVTATGTLVSPSPVGEDDDATDFEFSSEDEEGDEGKPKPTLKQVMEAIETVTRFSSFMNDDRNMSKHLDKIEEVILEENVKNSKQSHITDYFRILQ